MTPERSEGESFRREGARRLDGDLLALGALALLVALRFLPDWARGLRPFWVDLTYLHVPWRTYDAELLTAGRLPLWNPYLYFGMPATAVMQDALYYPGSAPFFFFGFPTALAVFEAFHYWLAGALAFLWLRRRGARRSAALAGAAVASLSGLLVCREPFLNHLAVLALAPALALFFESAALLAVSLALGFLAGYPPFLVASAAGAWAVALAVLKDSPSLRSGARIARAWALGGAAALGLGAVLLLPAAELVGLSRRSSGVPLEEALLWAFRPADLWQWVSPLVVAGFDPSNGWYKCCYLGFAGLGAALAGLVALPRRTAAPLAAFLAFVLLVTLGAGNALSAWLWAHLPPLRFVRYPGNTACLALLPLTALAAAGAQRLPARGRRLLAAAIGAELLLYAWGAFPRAPAATLTSKGPLAQSLQEELGGHRYLLSPLALHAGLGRDPLDWRWRLYGLTNSPDKLRAAGNFGEPLVPRANYELMDRLFSAAGPAAVAPLLPWLDVAALLTPPPEGIAKGPAGGPLWSVAAQAGAADARLLPEAAGEALGPEIEVPRERGAALAVERPREDALAVSGARGGWLFLAEPLYPGWKAWLETAGGPGLARALPALGPFQKFAVPAGEWRLRLRYEPASFARGLLLTLAAALLLGGYWYNRARRELPA